MKVDYLLYQNTKQITDSLIMVRPANFGFNKQTAVDNAFQQNDKSLKSAEISQKALAEFDAFVDKLRAHDIEVLVIEDTSKPKKTDAIFPNNWISMHENGVLVTYPMFAESRRKERREDVVEDLLNQHVVHKHYTFDFYEDEGLYLEGTGSMIFDRPNKLLYASLSDRTEARILEKFCVLMNYRKVVFNAEDQNGKPIYHTNVMMTLGREFAIICLDTIPNPEEKTEVLKSLERTGKEVIEISLDQMNSFAGNMLQVMSKEGIPYLIMSEQAFKSLDVTQLNKIRSFTEFLYFPIDTIEKYGGGSARCMIAENFLTKKELD